MFKREYLSHRQFPALCWSINLFSSLFSPNGQVGFGVLIQVYKKPLLIKGSRTASCGKIEVIGVRWQSKYRESLLVLEHLRKRNIKGTWIIVMEHSWISFPGILKTIKPYSTKKSCFMVQRTLDLGNKSKGLGCFFQPRALEPIFK